MTSTSSRPARIAAADPPEKIHELTQRQFYNFDQDVRGRLEDDVAAKLRDPAVVERWYLALVQMKKSVEAQLAAGRADLRTDHRTMLNRLEEADGDDARALRQALHDRIARHESQRSKRLRFLSAVEDSLAEARFRRNTPSELLSMQLLHVLEAAIRLHKESIAPGEATDADRLLWETVESGG
jgi:hypothetical protein